MRLGRCSAWCRSGPRSAWRSPSALVELGRVGLTATEPTDRHFERYDNTATHPKHESGPHRVPGNPDCHEVRPTNGRTDRHVYEVLPLGRFCIGHSREIWTNDVEAPTTSDFIERSPRRRTDERTVDQQQRRRLHQSTLFATVPPHFRARKHAVLRVVRATARPSSSTRQPQRQSPPQARPNPAN